jgi:hypothetical protein
LQQTSRKNLKTLPSADATIADWKTKSRASGSRKFHPVRLLGLEQAFAHKI